MTIIKLTPSEAHQLVHVGDALYTGDMKVKRGAAWPVYLTRIASLMRDPGVLVEITPESSARLVASQDA